MHTITHTAHDADIRDEIAGPDPFRQVLIPTIAPVERDEREGPPSAR